MHKFVKVSKETLGAGAYAPGQVGMGRVDADTDNFGTELLEFGVPAAPYVRLLAGFENNANQKSGSRAHRRS